LEFYEKYLLSGPRSDMRAVSIQVVGNADREYSEEIIQDLSMIGRGIRQLKKIEKDCISVTLLVPNPTDGTDKTDHTAQRHVRNFMELKSHLFTLPTN